ncbi:MAG: hypothetical protein P857_707 [Candidatus Xenolissoclinum pacificiensis L6]|uniref:Uncharacterized protein n=1 Tax=Candidatus Xenolissoclinum pacificiensis L6 TaxID=1401685 RepID=W2V0R0_9RICK|nr:MAG: hypothetical protein P857_707 [Candidatus Xenolissoclinum pacificiensis L6]
MQQILTEKVNQYAHQFTLPENLIDQTKLENIERTLSQMSINFF